MLCEFRSTTDRGATTFSLIFSTNKLTGACTGNRGNAPFGAVFHFPRFETPHKVATGNVTGRKMREILC